MRGDDTRAELTRQAQPNPSSSFVLVLDYENEDDDEDDGKLTMFVGRI
jgi:hypothetical protein